MKSMPKPSPKPPGLAYLDRNLTIRPISKASLEEVVAQFQRSAGNMGELSPAFPKAWIGQKAKAEPVTIRFLPKEETGAAPEAAPATPTA